MLEKGNEEERIELTWGFNMIHDENCPKLFYKCLPRTVPGHRTQRPEQRNKTNAKICWSSCLNNSSSPVPAADLQRTTTPNDLGLIKATLAARASKSVGLPTSSLIILLQPGGHDSTNWKTLPTENPTVQYSLSAKIPGLPSFGIHFRCSGKHRA